MTARPVTVVTESSTYVLDLEQRTATRLAGMGAGDAPDVWIAALRRDAESIPVPEVVQLVIGLPMVLWLQLREDGIPTLRSATTVKEIRS